MQEFPTNLTLENKQIVWSDNLSSIYVSSKDEFVVLDCLSKISKGFDNDSTFIINQKDDNSKDLETGFRYIDDLIERMNNKVSNSFYDNIFRFPSKDQEFHLVTIFIDRTLTNRNIESLEYLIANAKRLGIFLVIGSVINEYVEWAKKTNVTVLFRHTFDEALRVVGCPMSNLLLRNDTALLYDNSLRDPYGLLIKTI